MTKPLFKPNLWDKISCKLGCHAYESRMINGLGEELHCVFCDHYKYIYWHN